MEREKLRVKMIKQIKFHLLILSIFGCLTSCFILKHHKNDTVIQKSFFIENQNVQIEVTVDHYSNSKVWFYGSIELKNLTNKVLYFNFNQRLVYNNDTLIADYNILPISYAQQAFLIQPFSASKWSVAWKLNQSSYDKDKSIDVMFNTNVKEMN